MEAKLRLANRKVLKDARSGGQGCGGRRSKMRITIRKRIKSKSKIRSRRV